MNTSSESKDLTPCEALGYKVGDKFIVIEESTFKVGELVTLKYDDGSQSPAFEGNAINGNNWSYITLKFVEPCKEKAINNCNPALIAPKLWNTYKDVLNEEALEALKQVICDKINHGNIFFEDVPSIRDSFSWESTKEGYDFWEDVHNGIFNKQLIESRQESIERKHNHYFKKCGYEYVDVYRILKMFDVTDPCIQHCLKKLLCTGNRKHKDFAHDIQDVIDTLIRWQEMQEEDNAKQSSD